MLAICPSDSFSVAPSLTEPQFASPTATRCGYFRNLYLLDQDGLIWHVAEIEQRGVTRGGPFGTLVNVRLTFAASEHRPLGNVVDDLCHILELDDDAYTQTFTHAQAASLLRAARGAPGLIAAAAGL